jgi:hypothetical protein
MRLRIAAAALAAIIAGFSGSTWADHHGGGWHGGGGHGEWHHGGWHHHGGIFIGPTFLWPGFYDPFFYPPVPEITQPPPVYIERGDGNPPPATADRYWYYCDTANAYYPYVTQCPGGWKAVPPH